MIKVKVGDKDTAVFSKGTDKEDIKKILSDRYGLGEKKENRKNLTQQIISSFMIDSGVISEDIAAKQIGESISNIVSMIYGDDDER